MTKAVFVDRDGVINSDPGEAYYVRTWEEFRFQPGVGKALSELGAGGYKIFIVSNQSGVARGQVKAAELDRITRSMLDALTREGARIDGVFYCPHDDADACACRKPKNGLFLQAAKKVAVDFAASYNVGDSERDIAAGKSLGIKSVLVLSGKSKAKDVAAFKVRPDEVKNDLSEAVRWILSPKPS